MYSALNSSILVQTFKRRICRIKACLQLKFPAIYEQAFFKKGVNNGRNIFRFSKRAPRFSRVALQPTDPPDIPCWSSLFPQMKAFQVLSIKFIHPFDLSSRIHLFLLHGMYDNLSIPSSNFAWFTVSHYWSVTWEERRNSWWIKKHTRKNETDKNIE